LPSASPFFAPSNRHAVTARGGCGTVSRETIASFASAQLVPWLFLARFFPFAKPFFGQTLAAREAVPAVCLFAWATLFLSRRLFRSTTLARASKMRVSRSL
jgi:hypothetical protein